MKQPETFLDPPHTDGSTTMETDYFDQLCRLWKAVGAIQAYAKPDGPIATESGMTPEQRLEQIWAVVQDLEPAQP